MTDQLSGGVVQPTDAQIEALRLADELERDKWHVSAVTMQRAADCLLALAVPQAPLQAEPVPVVASEPSRSTWAADPWSAGTPACKHCGRVLSLHESQRYCPTPQAEPAVAEQAREDDLLEKIHADLRIMIASAKPDGDAWVTGYHIKTGALHRIVGHMQGAGYALNFPAVSMDRLAALASQSTPPAPLLGYEQTIDKAKACGARVTQHEIGFTHAEFAQFIASTPPPESAGQGLSDAVLQKAARYDYLRSIASMESFDLSRTITAEFFVGALNGREVDMDDDIDAAILAANPTALPDGGSKA